MKQQGLIFFDDLHLITIAFFLFFAVFLLNTWLTLRKKKKSHFERMAQMPLTEGNENE